MNTLRMIWSSLSGTGGLGIAVALATVAVAALPPVFRQPAIIVAVAAGVATGAYTKGRADERSFSRHWQRPRQAGKSRPAPVRRSLPSGGSPSISAVGG